MSSRRRQRALLAVASLTLVSSLAGLGVLTAQPAGADPADDPLAATTYQENAAHDGHYTDPSFTGSLTKDWSVDLSGDVGYPVIAHGLVFTTVGPGPAVNGYADHSYAVEALSLASGHVVWGPTVTSYTQDPGHLAYDGGRIFAINQDGELTAYDAATGHLDWQTQLTGQYFFNTPPTAQDGVVYLSGDGSGGTLYAVDEATGTVSWTAPLPDGGDSTPAVGDGSVLGGFACGRSYSFGLTGALLWHHVTECSGGGGETPVLHAGDLYVRDQDLGNVVLDETTGDPVGTFDSDTAPAFDKSDMATLTRPDPASDAVLSVWDTATHTQLWASDPMDYVTAPLFLNGDVVEGRADGTVEIRDGQDGSLVWSGSAGHQIDTINEPQKRIIGPSLGDGALVVPAGTRLTAFSTGTPEPSVWIDSGPEPQRLSGPDETFTFDSNVPGATYECTLDGRTSPCTSPVTYTDLIGGHHGFSVAIDGTSLSTELRWFLVVVTPPSVWITNGPAQYATVPGNSVLFSFDSDVPYADIRVYACTLDGDTEPCQPPYQQYSKLPNGLHSFSVSIDGITSETRWFSTYVAPPAVSITQAPQQQQTVGRTVSFRFDSNQSGATFTCSLDGVASPCTSPQTYHGLSEGGHTFSVALAGTTTSSETRAFVVDATGPLVRLNGFHPGVTHASRATIHWSATDRSGVDAFQLRVRRSARRDHTPHWVTKPSTHHTSATLPINPGHHLCVELRAKDGLGNWSRWSSPQCVVRPRH